MLPSVLTVLSSLTRRQHFQLGLVAAAIVFAIGDVAIAGDATSLGALDARATAGVSAARTADPGAQRMSLGLSGSEAVIDDQEALGAGKSAKAQDQGLLRDAHRASLFLGVSPARWVELSLGLHGTYENVSADDRRAISPEIAAEEAQSAAAGSKSETAPRQSAFAGASLMAKLRLLDAQGFQLAFAPFVESGAGERASYALTRSVGPKAGFAALMSYGALGVGRVDLNVGYRYRDPEQVGSVMLRNELFYKALAEAELTREFALFVAGEGRKLNLAQAGELDSATGKPVYRSQEAAEGKFGFRAKLGDAELTAFYGARLKDATGFGYGARAFGLSFAMEIGDVRAARGRHSIASEVEENGDSDKAKLEPTAQAKEKSTYEEYPEMIGAEIDPLEALKDDKTGDFADVDQQLKENAKNAKVESEDAKIEKELAEVRAAKRKADKIAEKQEAKDRAARNKEARVRAKDEEKMMKAWMQEANEELDEVEGIGPDEMNWNGLE